MKPIKKFSFYMLLSIVALSFTLSGCSGSKSHTGTLNMAPLAEMPAEVRSAPVSVQEAYRFAIANPDVLTQIPCYCGCGPIGHTSNYACYASGVSEDGSVQFDNHALGCSLCVDITQDTMRMMEEGHSTQAIKTYIDETYARYGPSNMTFHD